MTDVPSTCIQLHRATCTVSPSVDGWRDSSFIVTLEHTFLAQSYCVPEGCVSNPWLRDRSSEGTTCWGVHWGMSQPLPVTPWLLELPFPVVVASIGLLACVFVRHLLLSTRSDLSVPELM